MLAVSRSGDRIFLYEPRIGMSVPIVLDVTNREVRVEVPSAAELELDFAAVDVIDEVRQALSSEEKLVDAAVKFSRFYSQHFKSKIDQKNVTVAHLRALIRSHYENRAKGATYKGAVSVTAASNLQTLPNLQTLKAIMG